MMNNITLILTITTAFITAVVGPVLLEIVRSRLNRAKNKDTEDPLVNEIEADTLINEQIKILLDNLKADRVWITQFHNGGHFYTSGLSIKKFSIFYEVTSAGTSLIQTQFQNMPSSFYSRSLMELFKNNELCVTDINDESTTAFGLRDTAYATGAKSIFQISLRTPSGQFHGTLSVEFVKDNCKFTNRQKDEIRNAATYISGILSTIHKSN